jgi:aspartyl-tRNA(Asn)/glutamyl-tRNA(Gln) amidotransferase subunit A
VNLHERDAWELADAVRAGELSARTLLEHYLERIDRLDPTLNAICHRDVDGARATAAAIDDRVAAGEDPGPLAGLPFGVKELMPVAGWPYSEASLLYAERVAAYDAHEVTRVRAGGAVLVGATTASEFGAVSFTNTPIHGVTRNPWNPERTPGGSSGGSAAAVAAGMLPIASGSDGGGSIRIPSSYSGLFGWKPTFGTVGAGPGPFDTTLQSCHGAMARGVRDSARYVDVAGGPTPDDPTSLPRPPVGWEEQVVSGRASDGLRGLRAAWSSTLGYAITDPEVEKVVHEAARALVEDAGLDLVDIPVDLPRPGVTWGLMGAVDLAACNLDAARDRLDLLTEVPRAGLETVMHLRTEGLLKAMRRRQELLGAVGRVFEQVDLLLTPTTPVPAFEAEGTLAGEIAGQAVNLFHLSAPFTAIFNITGQPAASIPVGVVDDLPVALQVVARRHEDRHCLGAGALVEQARPWPKLAPLGRA